MEELGRNKKESLWIKQAFSHCLSEKVINELIKDPSKLKLGGARRRLTVLFADIRGFTRFSELHQPEEVVVILNECFTVLADTVLKYDGTLDKFVGDELMAFFGAPGDIHAKDHAVCAVKVALEMQSKMKELQEKWVRQEKEPLKIGIGINTGDMIVGNMGSLKRMDYTVTGGNVNLAARLCESAQRGEVLISDSTYEEVKDIIEVTPLKPIIVKGKAEPVPIYRVEKLKSELLL